jgi:SAM-dependent methyltransferase
MNEKQETIQLDKYLVTRNKDTPRFHNRTELMNRFIKRCKGNLLDLGCGEGNHSQKMIKTFGKKFNYFCLDTSKVATELTKEKVGKNATIIHNSIFKIKTGEYNTIVLGEVLEHINEDQRFLNRINQLLTSNGDLVISVPYNKRLWTKHDENICHKRRYDKQELLQKLKKAGFQIKDYVIWGFPLTRLLYNKLQTECDLIAESNENAKKYDWLLPTTKIVFSLDNLFNWMENGVGIIVHAKK